MYLSDHDQLSSAKGLSSPSYHSGECLHSFILLPLHFDQLTPPKVLILSFVGPRHARILLAHHDGTNLVIRQSKRFALWEKDIPNLKVLLRWWCSSGIGDTSPTSTVSK